MDVAAIEKRLPVAQVQVHGRIEAAAPGTWVDASIGLLREAGCILLRSVEEGLVDAVVNPGYGREDGVLEICAPTSTS